MSAAHSMTIFFLLLPLMLVGDHSGFRFGVSEPAAPAWTLVPFHYRQGARPQFDDGDAAIDDEARAVLHGLEHSLGLLAGKTDLYVAREAIVTWDHGRFALP